MQETSHGDEDRLLEADREWVDYVAESLHDRAYHGVLAQLAYLQDHPELLPPGSLPEEVAVIRSLGQDSTLGQLFMVALEHIDNEQSLEMPTRLFFCQAAVSTVNGFCIATPNLGVPVIVVNHGLVPYVARSVHAIMGLTSWSNGTFCEHFSDGERLDTLVDLAKGIRDRRPAQLLEPEAAACLPTEHPASGGFHDGLCRIVELFILFHELGHIALGHLSTANTQKEHEDLPGIPVFNRSQMAEFEADRWAFDRLVAMGQGTKILVHDLAYAVGCFFVLARVLEFVSPTEGLETHPSAAHRWEQMIAHLPKPSGPAARDSIDYILGYFGLWLGSETE